MVARNDCGATPRVFSRPAGTVRHLDSATGKIWLEHLCSGRSEDCSPTRTRRELAGCRWQGYWICEPRPKRSLDRSVAAR